MNLIRLMEETPSYDHERDWMDSAQCHCTPDDKSFIEKPSSPEVEERWANICAICPVFQQCKEWADDEKVSGVYVAGEWRD